MSVSRRLGVPRPQSVLVQHSEQEFRGQVSKPGLVSRHLSTVKKILEIHFAIAMLSAGCAAFSFLDLTDLGVLLA